jgi:hypothetical protein
MAVLPISAGVDAEVFDIDVDDLVNALKDHQEKCGYCTPDVVCEFGQVRLNAFVRAYREARREVTMWSGRQPTDIVVYRQRRRYRGRHRTVRRTWSQTVLVPSA